jgi:hypothetical protein
MEIQVTFTLKNSVLLHSQPSHERPNLFGVD